MSGDWSIKWLKDKLILDVRDSNGLCSGLRDIVWAQFVRHQHFNAVAMRERSLMGESERWLDD